LSINYDRIYSLPGLTNHSQYGFALTSDNFIKKVAKRKLEIKKTLFGEKF